ncbi:MAG: nucleotidyltransferase family protein [Candidatus Omnitrophica bacterium]|nr:nucleotidyltransferase family protein [Candidatus Omnitrophota bacterium]
MKSVILCAGYGVRMYPLTTDMAKPLLPIRGKPIIEYIINKIQKVEGMDEIFIVSNDKFFNQFNKWMNNYPNTIPIKLINDGTNTEKEQLGAVKDLELVIDKKNIEDDLLVVGGDNLFSFALSDFIKYSMNITPKPLIGVYDFCDKAKQNKFGKVNLNDNNQITDFNEKISNSKNANLVAMCLYFLPKKTLPLIKKYLSIYNDNGSIGNYIKWLSKNNEVHAFEFQGDWFNINDMDAYTEAVCSF